MATVARTPDAELLRRLRARDRQAWEELYVEYQPRLRAFAYRLAGNVHDADDLVQETFVRAVPRLDRLDPDTADVAAYLFATLKNLFLKQVERHKRQEPVAEVPEPVLPTPIEDDPERGTMLRSQQVEVRVANARLQPRQRLVLALRELEDRSYAEIGELVGMKENAVAQLIFRARESLRTELRLVQVDPESLPEECRRFLPLLAAHLDGQLKGARRDETLAHLEGCERCQAALADMREASRRYRTLFLPFGADEAKAATDERLEATGYWQTTASRTRGRLLRRVVAVVVAAVLLGVGGAALGVALARDDGRQAAPGTTQSTSSVVAVTSTTATTEVSPEVTVPPAPPKETTTEEITETTTPPTSPVAPPPTTEPTEPATTAKPDPKPQPKPDPAPKPKPKPKPTPTPTPTPDTTAPVVTITSGPAAATSADSVQIAFAANEAGVSFTCSTDGGAFVGCGSPVVISGIAPGQHSFSVTGKDKAGNVSQPVTVTWTYTPPDTTPPVTTISAAPPSSTTSSSASFTFSSNEAGSTFACALDGGAFVHCSSPVAYTSFAVGSHTFSVRATDPTGNTGQPASHSWTVVQPLPDLVISSFTKFSITITNRGTATAGPSILTITLVGTFTVPSLAPGASATFSWSTCRVGTYSAMVDRTNVVKESNESNNTASRRSTCP
jgi:RNA polymerase sigma factor (sigma-70 family)